MHAAGSVDLGVGKTGGVFDGVAHGGHVDMLIHSPLSTRLQLARRIVSRSDEEAQQGAHGFRTHRRLLATFQTSSSLSTARMLVTTEAFDVQGDCGAAGSEVDGHDPMTPTDDRAIHSVLCEPRGTDRRSSNEKRDGHTLLRITDTEPVGPGDDECVARFEGSGWQEEVRRLRVVGSGPPWLAGSWATQ